MTSFYTAINGQNLIEITKSLHPDLSKQIDPNGTNIVVHNLLHNDETIRAFILVKLKNSPQPMDIILDIPVDKYISNTFRIMNNESAPQH